MKKAPDAVLLALAVREHVQEIHVGKNDEGKPYTPHQQERARDDFNALFAAVEALEKRKAELEEENFSLRVVARRVREVIGEVKGI